MIASLSRVSAHPVVGPLVVVAGAAAVGAAVWFGDPTTPGGHLPTCPTKSLLGIVCPGCGAMRMIYSVMHGDLGAAVAYNAVGLVALVLLIWSFAAYCARLWTGRRWRTWQHFRYSSMTILVVVLVWFVIRNIPIAPFTALRV
ncbi:DUF2752 domain-containing protein [Gordonia araii NBRC 100433]|nr:DUF2752 domain-containing protein [Gordonia araii]NNG96403.1 DUF2752 domain-containing protein [Gordonia araii NBRC 100433]